MIMIIISYNVLQKRLISQKYIKIFSRKIRHDAIRSIRWISIRFDANNWDREGNEIFYFKMLALNNLDLVLDFVPLM